MSISIYKLKEREVHMVGDYVGVCWNVNELGDRYGDPYIDFVWIHGVQGDECDLFWEDEDSSVEGGIEDAEIAEMVADELMEAAKYLTSGKWAETE